jgi:hypothetical protein
MHLCWVNGVSGLLSRQLCFLFSSSFYLVFKNVIHFTTFTLVPLSGFLDKDTAAGQFGDQAKLDYLLRKAI